MTAARISCRSVSPSTVSARVCSSIWGSLRADAVADSVVGDGGKFEIHCVTPLYARKGAG